MSSITEQFEGINTTISQFKSQLITLQQQIKLIEKNINKEYNNLKKESEKKRNKGNKNPSGFAKPTKVTDELCQFMNKTEGSEVARTDVTKALIHYIEENKLQNTTNKKIINPDEKLKNLLGIEDPNTVLTYFNLQQYMNKHFSQPLKKVDPNNVALFAVA